MLDLNELRYFAAVVEQGSFSAAARVLEVPKSRLSRRIVALEDGLGVRLLQRSTRSVMVTELGQQFYQHCRAMLIEAQAAQELAVSAHTQPCGTVQIVCPTALLQMQVGAVLADYLQHHPAVQLKVLALNRPVDVIAEGVDIALRVRPDPLEDSELALRPLAQSPQLLVASPALLQRLGTPQTPADLQNLPSLALAGVNHTWQLQKKGKTEHAVTKSAWQNNIAHSPRLQCSDMATLRQAALAGLGVVRLPALWVQAEIARGSLSVVLPDWVLPSENIHAVFPSRRGQLPAVRVLLDSLAAAFARLGAQEASVDR